jgi:hypothetical protein
LLLILFSRIPLPEPVIGKHHANDLDKLFKKTRMKYLKQIVHKCDKLPNMEVKSVLDEFQEFYDVLVNLETEVCYFIY